MEFMSAFWKAFLITLSKRCLERTNVEKRNVQALNPLKNKEIFDFGCKKIIRTVFWKLRENRVLYLIVHTAFEKYCHSSNRRKIG